MNILKNIFLIILVSTSLLLLAKSASVNLISNPNVTIANPSNKSEPLNWSAQSWGNNNAKFTYLHNHGHLGSNSIEVQITTNSSKYPYSTFGDSKWVFNSVPVIPGDSYNFSDWYQSNVISEVIVYFNTANQTADDAYVGLRTANATAARGANLAISSNWSQYHETFVAPYNAKSITVLHGFVY